MALTINSAQYNSNAEYETVTAPIVSVDDAKPYVRAKQVLCSINPVQDLHGYDNPWPAGCGVNKLPPMVDGTYEGNGAKAVVVNGVATLSGTTTSSGNAFIIPLSSAVVVPSNAYYHIMNSAVNGSLAPTIENSNNTSQNISYSFSPANRIQNISGKAGITVDRVRFYIGNNVTLSGTYSPMICLDNTARSYSPYANICPITGFTGLDLWNDPKHGGNITWNQQFQTMVNNPNQDGISTTYDSATHLITIENLSRTTNYTSGSSRGKIFGSEDLIAGHKYLYRFSPTVTGVTISDSYIRTIENIFTYDWGGNILLRITKDYDFVSAHPVGDITNVYLNVFDLTQMFGTGNEPSTVAEFDELFPKSYYDYNAGTTTCVSAVNGDPYGVYPITWQSSAGTVYGGELDVTSGLLTVTHFFADCDGTENWQEFGSGFRYNTPNNGTAYDMTQKANWLAPADSSHNPVSTGGNAIPYTFTVGDMINVNFPDASTLEEFKAYLSEHHLQIAYERAKSLTRPTYQLTPTQIKMLLGTNNLWCDTGDTEVTYMVE